MPVKRGVRSWETRFSDLEGNNKILTFMRILEGCKWGSLRGFVLRSKPNFYFDK